MLTVQKPLVTPDFALRDTIFVLAGVVARRAQPPVPATLGGFAIGFASGLLGGALPTNQSQYLPSFLFAAVILVLLVRPNGLFTRARRLGGARVRRARARAARRAVRARRRRRAARHARVGARAQGYFLDSLVKVAIVVALYVFIGNSGVLSFGHISFVALGAWTAGVLSVPLGEKPAIMPNLAHFLRDTTVGNVPSLALAAAVGRRVRARRRAAADAALGPRRRHRDVRRARDHAQRAALLREDRPGPEHVLVGARDDRICCRRRSAR